MDEAQVLYQPWHEGLYEPRLQHSIVSSGIVINLVYRLWDSHNLTAYDFSSLFRRWRSGKWLRVASAEICAVRDGAYGDISGKRVEGIVDQFLAQDEHRIFFEE